MGRSESRSPSPQRRRSRSNDSHDDRRRKKDRSRSRSRGRGRQSRDKRRSRSGSRGRRDEGRGEAPRSRTLAVFNVSNRANDDDLYRMFDRYGRLERVKIVCDRKRGAQCGFAFITYEDQRDADDAKEECHGKDLDGRALRVDFSLTRRAHSPTPGVYKGRRRSLSRESGERESGTSGGRDGGKDGGRKRRSPSYGRRRRSPSYGNRRSRSR